MSTRKRFVPLTPAQVEARMRPARFATRQEWFEHVLSRLCRNHSLPQERRLRARYRWLLAGRFYPTSTLLTNAGLDRGSLGGCVVWPFPSGLRMLETQTVPQIRPLLRDGQGVGFDLTAAPPRAALLDGTPSPGPCALLLLLLSAVGYDSPKAGLKRPAFMASMIYDHPDIFELICLKRDRRISTVNTSVAVDSLFHDALPRDGHVVPRWTLDNQEFRLTAASLTAMEQRARHSGQPLPDLFADAQGAVHSRSFGERVGGVLDGNVLVSCKAIFDAISRCAHGCGDPGILNLSAINVANPTHPRFADDESAQHGIAVIRTTAPCGEQPLIEHESCFLGSLDLRSFVGPNGLRRRKLHVAAAFAACMLDDFISASDGRGATQAVVGANRKVGIGLMGLADVLAQLELPYGSEQARSLAVEAATTIQRGARQGSEWLAAFRGEFPNWKTSRFSRNGEKPRRNATLTTLAPTGHISRIANCSPSIEPFTSLGGYRDGQLVVHEALHRKLESLNYSLEQWMRDSSVTMTEWDGTLGSLSTGCTGDQRLDQRLTEIRSAFATAAEVSPDDHLNMVAAIQQAVENGISKTVVLDARAQVDDVAAIFTGALQRELKGITVFRLMP